MCGKQAFPSRESAKEHARRIAKAPRTYYTENAQGGSRSTRPYLCRTCGLWHLTSQTKREQRRIARSRGQR